ncbi:MULTISPECIES: LPS export ABC transporter periplasmic protein LptC [Rahnella]|jgi:lipopolysaccharide export system protein LptC|uniref:LPS export ABC transporter periplasmic protein LptC n=1 Tax=Rahnella TaxID=34037 RepID=UPI0006FA187B|nr:MULTISPECIES: LPS export ABC transporter periplasmic protein LptC [Rahnella]KQN60789.1 LPS export ABC transporter periplasmic protein LptC [Serratia sp. Leaf51]MBB6115393.1 lipopolysaccharide export system protein LptC [Rahnella inusitata]MBU9831934.1 LPS export ABC transporter periplasmic protein LptC [Rahnella rivi]THD48072.1 LPS export ABC transporter periplasmic protein LptC [Enterobacteriaceae bacterium ML5]
MNKTRLWIILVLTAIVLILIGWSLSDNTDDAPQAVNDQEPTYQSSHTVTMVYDPLGSLTYKLVSDQVKYYTTDQVTWFTNPVATMYDKNKVPTWVLRSDKAKMTQDKMLYLYGHVQADSLTPETSQLQRIKTDNAQVNLTTQDVASDDEVTLYGTGFTSNGMKMRGNLRDKTAELIEKVTTSYEIQSKK